MVHSESIYSPTKSARVLFLPVPPEWRDAAAAGNADLKQAAKLLRFIGGSSRRRAEPGHGLCDSKLP
jgi:hypothetical protein